jgi:hypothetical protein
MTENGEERKTIAYRIIKAFAKCDMICMFVK